MRSLLALSACLFLSGCLLDPFSSFEVVATIPDPVQVDRQLLSLEDYNGNIATDNDLQSPSGLITGFSMVQDAATGNAYLSGKGEGNIIVPDVDLSTVDSLTFSCWVRTYSNNFERMLIQSVLNSDTARIYIVNDRISVGVNDLNDSSPLTSLLFNGEWTMLTIASGAVNAPTPGVGPLIYINGELITSSSASLLKFDSGPALKLMDRFSGDFDGLKLYDVKLTAEEIRNLYVQTRGQYSPKIETSIVPDGLASYYRFDDGNGGIDDVSQLNGTFTEQPRFGPDVRSQNGRSLEFPSGGSRMEVPCSLFDNVNGFSLSFWAKFSTNNYNPMIIQGPNLFEGTHLVSFNNADFFCGDTNYCFNCGESEGFADGEWHHFTVVCSSINTSVEGIPMTLYVDGVFEATSPNSEINFLEDSPLLIGGDGSGTTFNGSIDNVRLYNRPITEEEVIVIFESGS